MIIHRYRLDVGPQRRLPRRSRSGGGGRDSSRRQATARRPRVEIDRHVQSWNHRTSAASTRSCSAPPRSATPRGCAATLNFDALSQGAEAVERREATLGRAMRRGMSMMAAGKIKGRRTRLHASGVHLHLARRGGAGRRCVRGFTFVAAVSDGQAVAYRLRLDGTSRRGRPTPPHVDQIPRTVRARPARREARLRDPAQRFIHGDGNGNGDVRR